MNAVRIEEQERRSRMRFPIRRELRYKLMEGNVVVAHGTGETINISSGGIWFTTGTPLHPGTVIELSISWPVLLDNDTRLRLASVGRVVRSTGTLAACTVDKYELRTQARSMLTSIRSAGDMLPGNQTAGSSLKAMAAAVGIAEPQTARSYMMARVAPGR